MVNFLKRAYCLAAVVLAAAFVAACGGGGSSDPAVVPPAPVLAQYQGTWAQVCQRETTVNNIVVGSSRATVVVGSPSATGSISVVSFDQYFNSADCTGLAVATITDTPGISSPAGTRTVGLVTAVKIDTTVAAGTSTFSGPAASLGVCGGDQFPSIKLVLGTGANATTRCKSVTSTAATFKGLLSFVSTLVTPNTFDLGDNGTGLNETIDSQGYPTVFFPATLGRYTKQ